MHRRRGADGVVPRAPPIYALLTAPFHPFLRFYFSPRDMGANTFPKASNTPCRLWRATFLSSMIMRPLFK